MVPILTRPSAKSHGPQLRVVSIFRQKRALVLRLVTKTFQSEQKYLFAPFS